MSLQVEKLEKNMAKLTIETGADELEKALESAFQKNKNKINIPGFRKGKAPRKMVEKLYGPEIFYEDAANELIPEAYEKALEECEEEIVSAPKIDVTQIEAGKPFIFTAEVALKPPVTLGKYKGLKVEKADLTVTDKEVDEQIEKERENSARTITVEDRPVKDGDITTLDFEGFVDGVAFDGGKGTDYPLTIGSGAFIPGFEEQLVGAEIGKETEVNVTFPEDYQSADLAGKAAVFKCTVKSIQEKELPALDDEFASEVSTFETLAEYREDVKKGLEQKKADAAKSAKEEAVIAAAVEEAQMEGPDAMIETEQRQIIEEFAQRLQMQGLSMEQYMQFTGMNAQSVMEQTKPQAIQRIQSRLVLEAIAKEENLTADEKDFEEEVKSMAEKYQMEPEQITKTLGERGKKQVLADIAINKAVAFLVANAKEGKAPAKSSRAKKSADAPSAQEAEESAAEE